MCLGSNAITSNHNKLLVNGFVRRESELEVSADVVSIICMFCNDELLHCLRVSKEKKEHFVIPLSRVLE